MAFLIKERHLGEKNELYILQIASEGLRQLNRCSRWTLESGTKLIELN